MIDFAEAKEKIELLPRALRDLKALFRLFQPHRMQTSCAMLAYTSIPGELNIYKEKAQWICANSMNILLNMFFSSFRITFTIFFLFKFSYFLSFFLFQIHTYTHRAKDKLMQYMLLFFQELENVLISRFHYIWQITSITFLTDFNFSTWLGLIFLGIYLNEIRLWIYLRDNPCLSKGRTCLLFWQTSTIKIGINSK